MVKVLKIVVQDLDCAGCNNGIYPEYAMIFENDGHIDCVAGLTCACHKGCSNTDCLPKIGQEFSSKEELFNFMEGGK